MGPPCAGGDTGRADWHSLTEHTLLPPQHWGFIFNPKKKKYALVLARSNELDQKSFE